ncbi:MAG: alcohol dehydrogenase [Chloroflexi bacterium RBG_19FT_COMBO_62_14]|nr:MAG: alcohol dehydrogenase [Chloroflexi bacterium RBG_19FT_COMBO_62_14]
MRAMVLREAGRPLVAERLPVPEPGSDQVLIRVHTCGVCHTDLHIVDRELPHPKLPLIPGHEIVGTVVRAGDRVERRTNGERVGVPWLGHTCGECRYCMSGRENLCDRPLFTGYTIDGGFAEYVVADQNYVFPIPPEYGDAEAAPLLCAGLIGYRSYRLAGEGLTRLGIYGFGAAAHIITQIARYHGIRVYAFTRAGDAKAQDFARSMGATWAGPSTERPPEELDAAIIFAPVGLLVPEALQAVAKGGRVVCGGIHMSDIPSFPYAILWGERMVRSVANLTRADAEELLQLAPHVPVRARVQRYPLEGANEALDQMRQGELRGAAVLVISEG